MITSTHYNRPDKTKQMLESLSNCVGIENYDFLACCEPGFPEVVEVIDKWSNLNIPLPKTITIIINDELKGCWINKKKAIELGFENSDYVIHVEDDVILGKDALLFFEFCRRYQDDPTVFSCTALSLSNLGDKDIVSRKKRYESHAFLLFKDRWQTLINDGWDGSDKFIREKYNLDHIYPILSRATHLGEGDGIGSHISIFSSLKKLGHQPHAFAGLSTNDKLEFVQDKTTYINDLKRLIKEEKNIDVKSAMEHQLSIAQSQDFNRQIIVNHLKEEWIKLDDDNVKSKSPSEYYQYYNNPFSGDYISPGFKEEKSRPDKVENLYTALKNRQSNRKQKKECDVVICCNDTYEVFLEECLDSVLRSSYVKPYIHCVMYDRNNLFGIGEKYKSWYKKYYKYVNFYISGKSTHYAAKMKVFPYLVTDYLATIDADDIMLPNRLWYQIDVLDSGYDACSGKLQSFIDTRFPGDEKRLSYISPQDFFVHSTSMIKKSIFEEMGGWLDLPCMADSHFSERVKDKQVFYSEDFFNLYRIHNSAISQVIPIKSKKREEIKRIIQEKKNSNGDLFKVQGGIIKI